MLGLLDGWIWTNHHVDSEHSWCFNTCKQECIARGVWYCKGLATPSGCSDSRIPMIFWKWHPAHLQYACNKFFAIVLTSRKIEKAKWKWNASPTTKDREEDEIVVVVAYITPRGVLLIDNDRFLGSCLEIGSSVSRERLRAYDPFVMRTCRTWKGDRLSERADRLFNKSTSGSTIEPIESYRSEESILTCLQLFEPRSFLTTRGNASGIDARTCRPFSDSFEEKNPRWEESVNLR